MNLNIIWLLAAPILRSVAGWVQSALEDGKITAFEWQQLGKTIFKLGIPAIFLYFGLNLDVDIAATLPVVFDYILNSIKKVIAASKNKA